MPEHDGEEVDETITTTVTETERFVSAYDDTPTSAAPVSNTPTPSNGDPVAAAPVSNAPTPDAPVDGSDNSAPTAPEPSSDDSGNVAVDPTPAPVDPSTTVGDGSGNAPTQADAPDASVPSTDESVSVGDLPAADGSADAPVPAPAEDHGVVSGSTEPDATPSGDVS